jgi:hypothetical protein
MIRTRRNPNGSLLVEGVAGTLVFVIVATFIIMGCVNLFYLMANYQKVQMAANAAAQVCNNNRFWLGTYRNDWDEAKARDNSEAAANTILNSMGLPNCTITRFDPSITGSGSAGYQGFICSHVEIAVGGFHFPYAKALGFSNLTSIKADGYSAASSCTPYATATIGFTPQGQADQYGRPLAGAITRRIQVPVIGFNSQTSSGQMIQPALGANGSAVGGGSYISAEVRSYGSITGDCLTKVNTSTQPNTFTTTPF